VCIGHDNGTPIALLIRNQDQRSKDYGNITDSFRPGHADFTYWKKYGIRDPRGGGRSSARLTAPVVAAGAIAKKWLAAQFGTTFTGGMRQIGEVVIPFQSWEHVNQNPFFAPTADAAVLQQLENYMDDLKARRLHWCENRCGSETFPPVWVSLFTTSSMPKSPMP
jgi:chorismate synthase